MWTSSKPLNAMVRPRPARIAYLVPESPSHALLDALIDESLSRWGGRRTPIIPTDGRSIAPAYWSFLSLWDADIIYSYVALSEEMESRIVCLFAPSEVHLHEGVMDHAESHALRPDFTDNFEFLSSLSLLPLFARRSQITGDGLPRIIDKEMDVETDRDLADPFGFVSTGGFFQSLLPHAQRVSLQPEPDRQTIQRVQEKVSYVEDAEHLVGMIATQLVKSSFAGVKAKTLGQLSRVVQELKPDVVMLAVMDKRENGVKSIETITEFEKGLSISDMRFELLSLDNATKVGFWPPFGKHLQASK